MRFVNSVLLVLTIPASLSAAASSSGELPAVHFASSELASTAMGLGMGETLLLEAVPLGEGIGDSTLEMVRFRVFAEDAVIHVQGADGVTRGPAPNNAYFRGHIAGDPLSWAALTVRAGGGTRGIVARSGRYWILSSEGGAAAGAGSLSVAEISADTVFADEVAGFSCGSGDLRKPEADLEELFGRAAASLASAGGAPEGIASYTARVAIETDFELFNRFGNTTDETDYIGDLFAYASTIYSSEVATSLLVGDVFLYSTAGDPWVQTSSGCGLMEFGKYWNDNRGAVDRTIAHFVSGKSSLSGIAWIGVLCSGGFTTTLSGNGLSCPGMVNQDNYGGAYGFTSGVSGSFDINNPSAVWDFVAVTHEIGHNFNSPHTHCYAGIGGSASPVDTCYGGQCGQSGCYCGAPSLPCAGGSGCGTIMSYCHLLGGGLSNISLTFGTSHPFGVAPNRVPDRMSAHVVSRASSNPGCLDLVPARMPVFSDGFESGTTSAWSSVVP